MENLGQLFITGISGTSLTDEEKVFLEEENIGGVILFSNNYESPGQLAELVNEIQACRQHYPLFIATDHEGGRVQRFKNQFTEFPPMLDLGLTESPKKCFEAHSIMAKELSACGVNVNFAPVCDVFSNENNKVIGDRAFAKTVDEVSLFVSSAIRGLQTNNVMACAKHFPGHGSTTKDSHYDLPVIKKSLADLKEQDIEPFVKAVRSRVEFVMMAHLQVDCIDPEMPTSLSSKAYQMLREELKFKKIIVTDDMEMKAISDRYSYGEAATLALKAGADVVEYRSMDTCREALEGVKEAYKKKELLKKEVDEKLDRINQVKKSYLSEYNILYIPDVEKSLGSSEHKMFLTDLQNLIDTKKSST